MRTLAVGDIHGCLTALETVLAVADFSDKDRLVTLGDYVDRGPDSRGVIDWLIECEANFGNLIPLRGNHDLMMLAAQAGVNRLDWLSLGGEQTLASYARDGVSSLEHVPEAHWVFLQQGCRNYFEMPDCFFVHATADPNLPLDEQPEQMLFWERCYDSLPHESGKTMICGHTAQKSGLPLHLGHAICIDTWVYSPTGWLTCLDVESGEYWQANDRGESRSGLLLKDFAE